MTPYRAFLACSLLLVLALGCLNVHLPEGLQRAGLVGVPVLGVAWVVLALVVTAGA